MIVYTDFINFVTQFHCVDDKLSGTERSRQQDNNYIAYWGWGGGGGGKGG